MLLLVKDNVFICGKRGINTSPSPAHHSNVYINLGVRCDGTHTHCNYMKCVVRYCIVLQCPVNVWQRALHQATHTADAICMRAPGNRFK